MKKKAIEKIPYLTLPKLSRKRDVKYIGVTAFKNIAHERHLLLEIYENSKKSKDVPIVRIVLTKKDFGNYFPEKAEWTRQKIKSGGNCYNIGLIWDDGKDGIGTIDHTAKRNILFDEKDLNRIKQVCTKRIWEEECWWQRIYDYEDKIATDERRKTERRKYERRQQALEERKQHTPELPESRILEYADRVIFHELHYLYYKKHGVRVTIACSKCGGVSDERRKPGISYESQFERMIQEPRMGEFGICPMCGTRGKFMPQGRAKSFYRKTGHLFLGQKYKETGMVFRYIEVEKEWQLQEICGEGDPEMYSSREKLSGIEITRAYFEPGKKIQKDYKKHNPYAEKDFWDDCNLYGLANITIREARILPETYRNMEGTFIQYSAMEEFEREAGSINPVDYIERYIQTPQIEMLVKLGLIGIVQQLVKCHYGIVADRNANRVETFLGIRKERVKQLIEKKGDADILRVMQMEKRAGQKWTEKQVEQLAETGANNTQIAQAMEHMTIQKLLNHISKYAGCEYGTMCSTAIGRLAATTQTYFDYLAMREALGYDMTNTVYLFPRDLSAAHTKMIQEHNKQEADMRIKKVMERYPLIKKNYRRLRKVFYYEDENFLIRPARDAGEIVMEGRILHHCVGGDNYLDKHDNGTSIILFLRFTKEPEMPYITVEIDMNTLNIRQWYGAHDKKPDQKNMGRWLDAYTTRLKCQRDGTDGVEIPLLAYA